MGFGITLHLILGNYYPGMQLNQICISIRCDPYTNTFGKRKNLILEDIIKDGIKLNVSLKNIDFNS